MNNGVFLVPILISLGAFAMIFGIVYMKNRENMAMIEKGLNPKSDTKRPATFRNLKWALLLIGAGIGLFAAYMLDNFVLQSGDTKYNHHHNNTAIYFSLIAIGGGLGLFGSYKIEKKELLDKNGS